MKEYGIPSIDCFKELFNSSKSDKIKVVYLLKSLILLEKFRKFPTAKEITLEFLNSNTGHEIKVEIANYILNERYISPILLEEFGAKEKLNYSTFIKDVLNSLNNELSAEDYFGTDFNFVRRETVFWLISKSEDPRNKIQSLFKEKLDWFDFPTQNGILDYCFQKKEELEMEFVIGILDKAIKVNMREVRITALKYAYLITKNKKYLSLAEKDPSTHIRKMASELKEEEHKNRF
ncbi:MAG: hypothetical protein AABX11_03505 [Nanoarchaeota archaeon]